MRWLLFVLAVGCSFEHGTGPRADADRMNPPDTTQSPARDLPHVPSANEASGSADYVFATTTIDTTTLVVTPAPPAGVTVETATQEPSGSELMLIRARSITLPQNITVTVTGSRPLVLIANTITIAGILDGGARLDVPGPNGAGLIAPALGSGTGGNGVHTSTYQDSGGGGGAFATDGARGGDAGTQQNCNPQANGGTEGMHWGVDTLVSLAGGGAGGSGSSNACPTAKPGAGGGVLQLSAYVSITIAATGAVNVGGGGGGAGDNCGGQDTGAGGGGGAGGALYLDAPMITRSGALAANGGAGGGGASNPGNDGTPGENGAATATFATGGAAGGSFGQSGGRGGFATTPPTAGGSNTCDGNGGGGGGSVGRIVLHVPAANAVTGSGVLSPPAKLDTAGF